MTLQNDTLDILVLSANSKTRSAISHETRTAGLHTFEGATVADAREEYGRRCFGVCILDLNENGSDFSGPITEVHRIWPEAETLVITTADPSLVNHAWSAGAGEISHGPGQDVLFIPRVRRALDRARMRQELCHLREHVAMNYGFDNIVGESEAVLQMRETARRIAPTDIAVLINGEAGTGKSLFARAIHYHSERRKTPFVVADLRTIPKPLQMAELFGIPAISQGPASTSTTSLLEAADGGTLYLDEIADMSPEVQNHLFNFLQDSHLPGHDSPMDKKLDVRIISSTSRPVDTLLNDGRFREDLFYRLSVIPMQLPPLAHRPEDIEPLSTYFLHRLSQERHSAEATMDSAALEKLLKHDWTGNVRELENTLKRAIGLCQDGRIEAEHIIFLGSPITAPEIPSVPRRTTTLTVKGGLLDSSQRTLIVKALDDNDWNFTRTAAKLGIGRTTLWRKIKKYKLQREEAETEEINV